MSILLHICQLYVLTNIPDMGICVHAHRLRMPSCIVQGLCDRSESLHAVHDFISLAAACVVRFASQMAYQHG